MSDNIFWQKKMRAFLHDSPQKPLDISKHEEVARSVRTAAGLSDDGIQDIKPADWFDASAERFFFPKGKCTHNFAEDPCFIHPLSSEQYSFANTRQLGQFYDVLQSSINGVETSEWRKKFFLYWRFWNKNAAFSNPDTAFLPADSRIPDHTIWTHMAMTAALSSCITEDGQVKPELFLFQLSPIQSFIAQARTVRDLWSGSYLISWLMAHALKAVTDELGPDSVVFPNLKGNGIYDLLHKDEMYSTKWRNANGSEDSTWDRILNMDFKGDSEQIANWLMTPTLPNRFLVIVPPGCGAEIGAKAERAVRDELSSIGESVWQRLISYGAKAEWKARWDFQIGAFPRIAWAYQPWLSREACIAELDALEHGRLDEDSCKARLEAYMNAAEALPDADKDPRYFSSDGKLNNSGILWSAHYALLDAKLSERRNTRDFEQWNPISKDAALKDSLSGKEECIGDELFWKNKLSQTAYFKGGNHRYGAMNLIKRLWCVPEKDGYLCGKLGISPETFKDSLPKIHNNNRDSYVAVIALDGDEMGKWISGAKTPSLLEQFAPKAHDYLCDKVKGLTRLLTPSFHLQFSEALSNFATCRARAIVKAHDGELIYAGGDDVLCVTPAKRAIACAGALRAAFREDFGNADGLLYPGRRTDVSAGICIGHEKSPYQMLVREAQAAEHDAKSRYGRSALSLRIYKRSGEIIHWGCKWESCAIPLMNYVTELSEKSASGGEKALSGRFPYALAEHLQPYQDYDADMLEIIKLDTMSVLARQGIHLTSEEKQRFETGISSYLEELRQFNQESGNTLGFVDYLNLFLAETFINRNRDKE